MLSLAASLGEFCATARLVPAPPGLLFSLLCNDFIQHTGVGVVEIFGAQYSLMREVIPGFERSTAKMGLIALAAHCGRFIFHRLLQPHLNGPDRVLEDDGASLLIDTRDGGVESSTTSHADHPPSIC